MTGAGDNVTVRHLKDGRRVATQSRTPTAGDKVVISETPTGKVAHISGVPTAGDKVVVTRTRDGRMVALMSGDKISCYFWTKRCAVCLGSATDDPETHSGIIVYGDGTEVKEDGTEVIDEDITDDIGLVVLKLCAYTYDGYISLLFRLTGEQSSYAVFEIHKCRSGLNYLFIETYGYRSYPPLSCWFNKGSENHPDWKLLSSCESGVLPYMKSAFKFSENKEVSLTTLLAKCDSCTTPEVCTDTCNTDLCTLDTDPVGTGGQTGSALPVSGITTSDLFYSNLLPACCDDDSRKVITGKTDLNTIWCTDTDNKCWDGDSWEWCQWYGVWFEKTWNVSPGNSNFFMVSVEFVPQGSVYGGGHWINEVIVDALGVHIINEKPEHEYIGPEPIYVYYHGPPLSSVGFYAMTGSDYIGNGCLLINIVCRVMGEFIPVVRQFTISSATASTEEGFSPTMYLESMFYVLYALIRVYKAVIPSMYYIDEELTGSAAFISDFSALTYEYYKEEAIPFTDEDNNGTLHDRKYPYKTVDDYAIGEYGIFRLSVAFVNDKGESEPKFYDKKCPTGNSIYPICIMDTVTVTPSVETDSVPPADECSVRWYLPVEEGILYSYRWTFTPKSYTVFPDDILTYKNPIKITYNILFYPDRPVSLWFAGTYSVLLELNVARNVPVISDAAPIQTIILDDITVPTPDPYDSLGISIGSVSSGKRQVTFSFYDDWYRTGLTLVCNDDAHTTVTRTQSSRMATLSNATVTYTCSAEPYTVEYTVSSPESTKTYYHKFSITATN
jgi:hypothetical protein